MISLIQWVYQRMKGSAFNQAATAHPLSIYNIVHMYTSISHLHTGPKQVPLNTFGFDRAIAIHLNILSLKSIC